MWTPIGNAVDAYRRRVLADDGAVYEHIWRLIHIHEATVVLLGTALASRLMHLWENDASQTTRLNDLRNLVTGIRESALDESEAGDSESSGCMGGSIGAWIDLLNRFGASEAPENCAFCKSLKEYLSAQAAEPLNFLPAWQRIIKVPAIYCQRLTRVQKFYAINSLRNKIAHVPLPAKVVQDLHSGLRAELLDLLTPDAARLQKDPVADVMTKSWHPPLHGKFVAGKSFVTGVSEFGKVIGSIDPDTKFVWPDTSQTSSGDVVWSASPFVRLDGELKVALLFRVPEIRSDPEGELTGEFHRFAAEVEPVVELQIPKGTFARWIPKRETPKPEEPQKLQAPTAPEKETSKEKDTQSKNQPVSQPAKKTPQELRSLAEDCFRDRDYPNASRWFADLAASNSVQFYNDVAKSKYGAALWRAAERASDLNEQKNKMRLAIELLEQAMHHSDPAYSARAYYEGSKASWHLWKVDGEVKLHAQSLKWAEKAAHLDFVMAYISWHERLVKESEDRN